MSGFNCVRLVILVVSALWAVTASAQDLPDVSIDDINRLLNSSEPNSITEPVETFFYFDSKQGKFFEIGIAADRSLGFVVRTIKPVGPPYCGTHSTRVPAPWGVPHGAYRTRWCMHKKDTNAEKSIVQGDTWFLGSSIGTRIGSFTATCGEIGSTLSQQLSPLQIRNICGP